MEQQRLLTAVLLSAAVLVLVIVPPSFIERLPSVCLHHRLAQLVGLTGAAQCPGCGSVRALSHLLHGDPARAVRFNPNCLLTAPLIIGLIVLNFYRFARARASRRGRPAGFKH